MFTTLSTKLMALGIGLAVVLLAVIAGIALIQQKSTNTSDGRSESATQEPLATQTPDKFIEAKNSLVAGFPELPAYPNADLKESSKRAEPKNTNRDFTAEWTTHDEVPKVAEWYLTELPKHGWKIEETPNDRASDEQIIKISQDGLAGYVAVEYELDSDGGIIEIVADFRKAGQ